MKLPKKRATRWLLLVLAVLVSGGLVYASVTALTLFSGTRKVTHLPSAFPNESLRPSAAVDETANGENILLLGIDSKGNTGKEFDEISGSRADSIMVAHVSKDAKYLTIISIVRDTWVDIPGIGENRINSALSLGGVSTMVATVEQVLQTRIDHVAIVDFEGFKGVIDHLGGVTVENPEYFTYSIAPYYEFPEGTLTLDGKLALAFSRERKNLTRGDFQRAENQRAVILSLLNKGLNSGLTSNPLKAAQIFESLSPYLSVDDQLDFNYARNLGRRLTNLQPDGVGTFTLQIASGGINDQGMSVVYLDEERLAKVRRRLGADTIQEYLKKD